METIVAILKRERSAKGVRQARADAVLKLLYLAINRAKGNWKAPIAWSQALAHFSIVFADRFPA
jgi:transposase-like protein